MLLINEIDKALATHFILRKMNSKHLRRIDLRHTMYLSLRPGGRNSGPASPSRQAPKIEAGTTLRCEYIEGSLQSFPYPFHFSN